MPLADMYMEIAVCAWKSRRGPSNYGNATPEQFKTHAEKLTSTQSGRRRTPFLTHSCCSETTTQPSIYARTAIKRFRQLQARAIAENVCGIIIFLCAKCSVANTKNRRITSLSMCDPRRRSPRNNYL